MSEIFDFLLRHWELSTLFVVVAAAYVLLELRTRSQGVGQLAPEQVVQMMNHQGAVVIDLRAEAEFKEAHIIRSLNLPYAQLEHNFTKLNAHKNKKIIVVTGPSQSEALQMLKKLQSLGAKDFDLNVLQGGIPAWRSAQLPLQKK